MQYDTYIVHDWGTPPGNCPTLGPSESYTQGPLGMLVVGPRIPLVVVVCGWVRGTTLIYALRAHRVQYSPHEYQCLSPVFDAKGQRWLKRLPLRVGEMGAASLGCLRWESSGRGCRCEG